MKLPLALSLVVVLLTGCISTPPPNAEFVGSVNFTPLDTFSYKHTLISGLDFRDSEELMLETLSDEVLSREFENRGFEKVESDSDFYVVVKWRKAVSSYPSHFDSIDGPLDSLNRRDNPSYRFASRLHLIIEIYESETNNLFWRNDLPNIFDSLQFTAERIDRSLTDGVKNFPKRVEKDPNLPNID